MKAHVYSTLLLAALETALVAAETPRKTLANDARVTPDERKYTVAGEKGAQAMRAVIER